MTFRNIIIECIIFSLLLLFVYTATSKLMAHASFKGVLSASPLIGKKAAAVAIAIPALEIIIALLLFAPPTRKMGLLASAALMTLFTMYIGYMIVFTPHLPCSCGGVLKQLSWKEHLIFNLLFTGLAIAGYKLEKNKQKFVATDRTSRTPV